MPARSTGKFAALEMALGHHFGDQELLRRALTHKSRAHELVHEPGQPQTDTVKPGADCDNEQLEFLGDAVLGFVVSDSLVRRYPEAVEGRLSKLKSHLVSAARLYEVAQAVGLGSYLLLGRGEEMSGGREKKALLADAVEALIAAMFLDGGMEPARRFIEQHVLGGPALDEDAAIFHVADYKSELQEAAQARKFPLPRYLIVDEDGPEHAKTFTVEVRLGKQMAARARGQSKKSAGQKAAQAVLAQLAESGETAEVAETYEKMNQESGLEFDLDAEAGTSPG